MLPTGNEWLHWGHPPCGAKRHMDLMCTSRISVQVTGKKMWRLYPLIGTEEEEEKGEGVKRMGNWTEVNVLAWVYTCHTHIHTHPHTLICTHILKHSLIHTYTDAHMHTHTPTHPHTGTAPTGSHTAAGRCTCVVPRLGT